MTYICTVEQKYCFAVHLFQIGKQIEKVDFNLMLSTKRLFLKWRWETGERANQYDNERQR